MLANPPPDSTNLREWFEKQLAEYCYFMDQITVADAQMLSLLGLRLGGS